MKINYISSAEDFNRSNYDQIVEILHRYGYAVSIKGDDDNNPIFNISNPNPYQPILELSADSNYITIHAEFPDLDSEDLDFVDDFSYYTNQWHQLAKGLQEILEMDLEDISED